MGNVRRKQSTLPTNKRQGGTSYTTMQTNKRELPIYKKNHNTTMPKTRQKAFLRPSRHPRLYTKVTSRNTNSTKYNNKPPRQNHPLNAPTRPKKTNQKPTTLTTPRPRKTGLSTTIRLNGRHQNKGNRHRPPRNKTRPTRHRKMYTKGKQRQ